MGMISTLTCVALLLPIVATSATRATDALRDLSHKIRQDRLDTALRLASDSPDSPSLEDATEAEPAPLYWHAAALAYTERTHALFMHRYWRTAVACSAALLDRCTLAWYFSPARAASRTSCNAPQAR